MKDSEVSKLISYWLRHKPEDANINLDRYGWASIDEILFALSAKKIDLSIVDLIELNNSFDKIRWEIDESSRKIKATHGHSVQIELEYLPSIPPSDLFHGTSIDNVISITEKGLLSQSRLYVHLTDNYDSAIKIGMRHGRPIVIELNTKDLLDKGWLFYKTEQNVWLTNDIPVEHLTIGTWTFCPDLKTKVRFLEQLKIEVCKDHQLFNVLIDLELIAYCYANDDCLFISKSNSKYYLVHLTWSNKSLDKTWPFTRDYSNFKDFIYDVIE